MKHPTLYLAHKLTSSEARRPDWATLMSPIPEETSKNWSIGNSWLRSNEGA
jgi:hypothetical protein